MEINENTRVVIQLFECEWNGRQDRKNNNFSLLLQTFQKLQNCYILVHSRVQSLGKSMWQLRQSQAEVFTLPPRCCCCFRRRRFCCCRRRRRRCCCCCCCCCCCRCRRRRLHDFHNYRDYNRKDADPSGCAV